MPPVLIWFDYQFTGNKHQKVNPATLLDGVPTIVVLHHIAQWMSRVAYAQTDPDVQREILETLAVGLPRKTQGTIQGFIRRNPTYMIASHDSLCMLMHIALMHNQTIDDYDDTSLELTGEECQKIFNALLYCNSVLQELQVTNADINHRDLISLSLRLDLPIVEFKIYKDFKCQFVKAVKFFEFLQNHSHYSKFLPYFYSRYNVSDWREYLLKLFSMLETSLRGIYIDFGADKASEQFFGKFVIDITAPQLQSPISGSPILPYFRDHFLIECAGKYLIMDPNLLVDKIYQGIKFMMFSVVSDNGLCNAKGKPISSYNEFSSIFGTEFSEHQLFYQIIKQIFTPVASRIITGEEFIALAHGINDREPDLYMRVDDKLIVFECKDLTLGDSIKFSASTDRIIQGILDRICLYPSETDTKPKYKGFGQLHRAIDDITVGHVIDTVDPDVRDIKTIYPIVVTNDTAFSANGVNALIIDEYSKIMARRPIKTHALVRPPLIIDLDTLIKLGWRLNQGQLNLFDLIDEYTHSADYPLASFTAYIHDHYILNHTYTPAENTFLFGDFLNSLKNYPA